MLMHESERRGYLVMNGLGITDQVMSRLLKISEKKWRNFREKITDLKICSIEADTGALYSRRMVRDEEERQARVEEARKNGRLGGNPHFQRGQRNPYKDNPQHNPSHNPPDNPPLIPLDNHPHKGPINSSSSSASSSSRREERRGPVHTGDNPGRKTGKSASPSPPSPLGLAQEGGVSELSNQDAGYTGTEEDVEAFVNALTQKFQMPGGR